MVGVINKKQRGLVVLIVMMSVGVVFADAKVIGDTDFSSGWVHYDGENIWYTTAGAGISVNAVGSKTVKACVETSADITSIPETAATTAGYVGALFLDKAYVKMRLPWFNDEFFRLSVGKMPVGWGYGLYYNAGDLIFGASPTDAANRNDTKITFTSVTVKPEAVADLDLQQFTATPLESSALSSSGLSDLRVNSDWCVVLNLPLTLSSSVEIVGLPPIDTALNSSFGRFGARVAFQPSLGFLENCEAGYLTHGDLSHQSTYLGIDGTLWLDYNVCASTVFVDNTFDDSLFTVSVAFIKTFAIRTETADHSLQLRAESLWYPFADKVNVFCFASYDTTEKTNCTLSYIMNRDNSGNDSILNSYAGFSFSWIPVSPLELSIQGIIGFDDSTAGIIASVSYSY